MSNKPLCISCFTIADSVINFFRIKIKIAAGSINIDKIKLVLDPCPHHSSSVPQFTLSQSENYNEHFLNSNKNTSLNNEL